MTVGSRTDAFVYGAAILAGAALVFQIQPIAGKLLLPSFGGGASVWTTCMFFFQAMLLAGYVYAHLLTRIPEPRRQVVVHVALLLVSLLFLPVGMAGELSAGARHPVSLIFLVLLMSIGVPFVMLASTAPLIQKWSSVTRPEHSPYRLYALSNGGALLALLAYPLLVEPNVSLSAQTVAWSMGYALFVVALLGAARLVWVRNIPAGQAPASRIRTEAGEMPGRANTPLGIALTVCLAASGVIVLLAVTNEITQNVAPIPFLWILPLVCYLLTYIICFSGEQWYDRAIWGSLFVVAAGSLIILHFFATSFTIVPVVVAYVLVLFCACMVCHGELYRLRPDTSQLTGWYLLIALGGAIGGASVSVVAPIVFDKYWETLVGVFLIYIIFGVVVLREVPTRRGGGPIRTVNDFQKSLERWGTRFFAAGWSLGLFLFPAVVVQLNTLRVEYDVASSRNFYGLLNVRDVVVDGIARRVLVDGTTIHGFQLLEEAKRSTPTSYYGSKTGVASLLENFERTDAGLRVGIIGLGTGTLAAYGEADDEYRFYELNPAVVDAARRYFSFLQDSPASVDIVLGDGRVSMERELRQTGSRHYDVLVVDAFNSDSIPVHLLTLEALELYWAHLKPDGVLALHLTNNYLDLVPVAGTLGNRLGKEVLLITTPRDVGVSSAADWVLLLEDSSQIAGDMSGAASASEMTLARMERVWTDDYSNLLGTLRQRPK